MAVGELAAVGSAVGLGAAAILETDDVGNGGGGGGDAARSGPAAREKRAAKTRHPDRSTLTRSTYGWRC
jgi:hypothetical protein